MDGKSVIVSLNVIGTGGKLVNPGSHDGTPFLFYCNDESNVESIVTGSPKLREMIEKNVLVVENYTGSRLAFCWYINDQYNSRCIDIERWIPLAEAGDLDMRFLRSICSDLLQRAKIEGEIPEDGDILESTHKMVSEIYPGRFSRLTMHNYIREELKKIGFTEDNYLHMIDKIKTLKKDERDKQQERSV